MNLLLVERHELTADGRVVLRDRRAHHLRTVLGAAPGRVLRAGILDGPLAIATVLAVGGGQVELALAPGGTAPVANDVLLLAAPRPKVLLRIYAHAAALGFGVIVVFRSWKVDKSHLTSRAFDPAIQREHLLLGLEQAGRTRLPAVRFCPLFHQLLDDEIPRLAAPHRFVAHPAAPLATSELAPLSEQPFAVAVGPDGGLLPYEVERLERAGFVPVRCAAVALRTETAVAVLWGQLDLLRRRRLPGGFSP